MHSRCHSDWLPCSTVSVYACMSVCVCLYVCSGVPDNINQRTFFIFVYSLHFTFDSSGSLHSVCVCVCVCLFVCFGICCTFTLLLLALLQAILFIPRQLKLQNHALHSKIRSQINIATAKAKADSPWATSTPTSAGNGNANWLVSLD